MNTLCERPDTAVPTPAEARVAQESSRVLARARPDRELHVSLGNGETVPLPRAAARLLTYLLTEMGEGNAVTLIPIHAELTTQEAADYLRVSRPYLISLLEKGAIKHHKVGTHRRVVFADLKRFKDAADAESKRAMERLAEQAQKLNMGY